jgi:hypothetical protein
MTLQRDGNKIMGMIFLSAEKSSKTDRIRMNVIRVILVVNLNCATIRTKNETIKVLPDVNLNITTGRVTNEIIMAILKAKTSFTADGIRIRIMGLV